MPARLYPILYHSSCISRYKRLCFPSCRYFSSQLSSSLLGIPAEEVDVISYTNINTCNTNRVQREFTEMFRSMSPYINVHRGTTIVIHLCGELIDSDVFYSTMQDIALLSTFGIKLVLVAGSRPQINQRLKEKKMEKLFDSNLRILDSQELGCAMDAAGFVRVKIESALGRGVINAPDSKKSLSVSSGNYLTAQPVGVRGGIDYKFAGTIRRINVSKLEHSLNNGDIVLLNNLGYSASGEIFVCMSEHVASRCAIELKSHKLIFLHHGEELSDQRTHQRIKTLLLQDAISFHDIAKKKPNIDPDFLLYFKQAIQACSNGVKRVHLVNRHINGCLIEELFTRDGGGIMLSKDMYEDIRIANPRDITGIMRLIQPLLDKDVLVSRSQEQIESTVNEFFVVERDGAIIACAALQLFENGFAEMSCVAVDKKYRRFGKGNAILGYLLRKAQSLNVEKVFVMTTRTSHWFSERGFQQANISDLPPSKLATIDTERNSKVYIFDITQHRAIDEQELLLN